MAIRWVWDEAKNVVNRAKHGLSFATASRVFDDPLHLSTPDPHPDADRWQTLGLVGDVVLLVVHTLPEGAAATTWRSAGLSAPARRRRGNGGFMKRTSDRLLIPREEAEL